MGRDLERVGRASSSEWRGLGKHYGGLHFKDNQTLGCAGEGAQRNDSPANSGKVQRANKVHLGNLRHAADSGGLYLGQGVGTRKQPSDINFLHSVQAQKYWAEMVDFGYDRRPKHWDFIPQ